MISEPALESSLEHTCASSSVLDRLPQLRNVPLRYGDRWIFSAGFNVDPEIRDDSRIREELSDLATLAQVGCRVAILSHQGNCRDGSARALDYVAAYLQRQLGRQVAYVPDCCGAEAETAAQCLRPGDIALFGNTRRHAGEELNDSELARTFARLGNFVAVGGFCKAHRAHASNVGILDYRPGFAASGLVAQARSLQSWAGRRPGVLSVAALGGLKSEKITIGLKGLVEIYDYIVVGGAVLNTVLAALGCRIGDSLLSDNGKVYTEVVRSILEGPFEDRILIPDILVVQATGRKDTTRTISRHEGVPDGYRIVDFEPSPATESILARLVSGGGRLLIAGPPGKTKAGHTRAADRLRHAMRSSAVRTILLGGDSAAELPFEGQVSSGGGSALHFLCDGTTMVFGALIANRKRHVSHEL